MTADPSICNPPPVSFRYEGVMRTSRCWLFPMLLSDKTVFDAGLTMKFVQIHNLREMMAMPPVE